LESLLYKQFLTGLQRYCEALRTEGLETRLCLPASAVALRAMARQVGAARK
jgi:hypothetical protein